MPTYSFPPPPPFMPLQLMSKLAIKWCCIPQAVMKEKGIKEEGVQLRIARDV